jgi:hypothetical protein
MRKLIILLFLALPLSLFAQSSMTDSQVASYIQQEVKRGTSQSQIVTHLMQNGVDISQIRRVRNAYERMQGDKGLGTTTTSSQGRNRLRQGNSTSRSYREQRYNEDDADFKEYSANIAGHDPVRLPSSAS